MSELHDFAQSAREGWQRRHPDADLDAYTLALRIHRLGQLVVADHAEAAARSGFGVFGDYEVCALLTRSPSPLRPTQLADALRLTKAGITGRLDRLERQGFVARTTSEFDGRSVDVQLTRLGQRRVDQAFGAICECDRRLFAHADRGEIGSVSELLAAALVGRDPSESSHDTSIDARGSSIR